MNAALNSARPTLVVGLPSAGAVTEEGDKGCYQIKQYNYPGKYACLFFVEGKLSQLTQLSELQCEGDQSVAWQTRDEGAGSPNATTRASSPKPPASSLG